MGDCPPFTPLQNHSYTQVSESKIVCLCLNLNWEYFSTYLNLYGSTASTGYQVLNWPKISQGNHLLII